MVHVVTVLFAVQAVAGALLLRRWWRHGRRGGAAVLTHAGTNLGALVLWTVFAVTGAPAWAWVSFGVLTVGNAIGDALLVRRSRSATGRSGSFWRDYGRAVSAVFRGETPRLVGFHALFSGVVYFTCLGVCIGASLAQP